MAQPANVEALKQLALLGAMNDHVELASADFAELIDVSQQTGSRRLIDLSTKGLVQREMGVRKQRIRITEAGRSVLHAEHALYQRLFEMQESLELQGTVQTGLGEGRYYLSRPGYEDQFIEHLGWKPYPGTLNVALTGAEANKLRILKRDPVHLVDGFTAEGRTFGGVICSPGTINGLPCAAILPNRSHYTQTLEVIAPVCLREAIPCDDGARVTVNVQLAGRE